MLKEKKVIWQEGEYNYPMAYGFVPNIMSYIHEEDQTVRPCMLVVPGGGYGGVSPTEGEIVAMEFYHKGYNCFVLTYTVNPLTMEPLKDQPMKDLSRGIRMIRKNAKSLHIDPEKLVVCGFSAGGHLCASVCVHFEDIVEENPSYQGILNRPSAAILAYPVITSGEKAHRGSFDNLLGRDPSEEELAYMSLEKHVTEKTPPCFLWQTAEDEAVPVENSYLFALACLEKGVLFSHHVFTKGHHGLSLANDVWAGGVFEGQYTLEQMEKIAEKAAAGEIALSQEERQAYVDQFDPAKKTVLVRTACPDVAVWPELAVSWLNTVFAVTA